MELIRSLDYVDVLVEHKEKRKSAIIKDLIEAFKDAEEHGKGKKKLKKAKDFLN